jgi:hypothetical protein
MEWAIGRLLALPLRVFAFFVALCTLALRPASGFGRSSSLDKTEGADMAQTRVGPPQAMERVGLTLRLYMYARRLVIGLISFSVEIRRLRSEARQVSTDLFRFASEQCAQSPLERDKKTIFLVITCGQAVRNFLLSDVLVLLTEQYNVVILSPFAYSESFRRTYAAPGVHILPWFESFRSSTERLFQYYLMRKSGSRTHQGWLANLEARTKTETEQRYRFRKHYVLLRMSDALGSVIGQRGMQALAHSYFLAHLPKSMFKRLFAAYKPALVVSTTAHHAEAWPLTYFGRRHGCRTVANILSWDNTSTKPAMDTSCDRYTVWSSEMEGEFARNYPYVKTSPIVTGSPMFDMYYNRRGAMDRETFLNGLGLSPHRPYVLWTTNTPAGMPDEHQIIRWFWGEIDRSPLARRLSLLVRLHPKEDHEKYTSLRGLDNVALTLAGPPHWHSSDRWLPSEDDMRLLLNSMLHAAVSVNVASTMSLESFALNLPTINVAFKSSNNLKDHNLMWSFDMYHSSDHYRAIVDNGAVGLARSMDELLAQTIDALAHPNRRQKAMQETLKQKAAYCDGTSARHFVRVLSETVEARDRPIIERPASAGGDVVAIPVMQHEGVASSTMRGPRQRKRAMGT